MKNKKLKLDELKVQSFITDFDKEQGQTLDINGGGSILNLCLTETISVLDDRTIRVTIAGSCAGGCPTTTYFDETTYFDKLTGIRVKFQ